VPNFRFWTAIKAGCRGTHIKGQCSKPVQIIETRTSSSPCSRAGLNANPKDATRGY
jgi:hypothetical protein